MVCSKPSGDPGAIDRAARAIDAYANDVARVFGQGNSATSVTLAAAWTGDAADRVANMLNGYQGQLDAYSSQLHDYAAQLRQYAAELRRAQTCSLSEILTWVFMIIFTIVEIVVGLLFGGVLSAAFASLAGGLAEALESSATVARIVTTVTRVGASIGRMSGFEAELGADFVEPGVTLAARAPRVAGGVGNAAVNTTDVGASIGARPVVYVVADALSAGRQLPGEAVGEAAQATGSSASSGIRSAVTDAVENAATRILEPLAKNPTYVFDKGVEIAYSAVYNLGEWYSQEVFIRLISSLDPQSEGFTHMWDGETEKTEALAIFAGMILGSIGVELSEGAARLVGTTFSFARNLTLKNGVDLADALRGTTKAFDDFGGVLRRGGDDIGDQIDHLLKTTGTGGGPSTATARQIEQLTHTTLTERTAAYTEFATEIEKSTGTKIREDVLKDVLENVWQYGAILALYPAIAGEDFDWKEWGWYVVYGLVEGLTYPAAKHFTRKPMDNLFGHLFTSSPTFEKDHPLLNTVGENLGDLFVVNGLSILRKVTLDPLGGIEGSYTDYQEHLHEAPELEDTTFDELSADDESDEH